MSKGAESQVTGVGALTIGLQVMGGHLPEHTPSVHPTPFPLTPLAKFTRNVPSRAFSSPLLGSLTAPWAFTHLKAV